MALMVEHLYYSHSINSYDDVSECITFFDCSVSMLYINRKLKFLTKLQHLENAICKLFEKYIIDELDIVHEHLFSQVI